MAADTTSAFAKPIIAGLSLLKQNSLSVANEEQHRSQSFMRGHKVSILFAATIFIAGRTVLQLL